MCFRLFLILMLMILIFNHVPKQNCQQQLVYVLQRIIHSIFNLSMISFGYVISKSYEKLKNKILIIINE